MLEMLTNIFRGYSITSQDDYEKKEELEDFLVLVTRKLKTAKVGTEDLLANREDIQVTIMPEVEEMDHNE